MLRFLVLLFIGMSLSPQAFAQPIDTHLDLPQGRVRYQEAHPREVRLQNVTVNGRTHTVKAYGTMYISFMASMIATELAYCNHHLVPFIANNEETPNCRDELLQMLLDPGMNLGIIAMTFTSLEFYRRGDRVLKRFLNQLLTERNANGTFATGRTRKALRLSQTLSRTLLQHLSMGAGMMVQTSIASSWNAPKMRECFATIKNGVKQSLSRNSINTNEELQQAENAEDIVSKAVDEQMQSSPCAEAKEHYFDAERGTLSELAVTIMSLGASTLISGTMVTGLRFIGIAMLGMSPVGMGVTGGLIVANFSIEMIDRILEPYIRAFYHAWNSRRLMKNAFANLVEPLDLYSGDQKLIRQQEYEVCTRGGPQFTCYETETRSRTHFPLLDALDDYKYALDYRREAKLNRFIENHGRWESKVSTMLSVFSQFQDLMRKLYEIREQVAHPENLDTYYNFYQPITYVEDLDFSSELDLPEGGSQFNAQQLSAIYEILNEFRSQISLNYYDQNRMLRLLFEELHVRLHQNDSEKIFLTLWRLKNMVADLKARTGIMSTHIQTGVDFSRSDFERIESVITNLFTSFTPQTLQAFLLFESAQLPVLEEIYPEEQTPDPNSPGVQNQLRRGVMMTSEPIKSLLEMNKDDNVPFYENQRHFLREKVSPPFLPDNSEGGVKYGIEAKTVPSRIVTHLLCGDFNDTRFYYNDGRNDTLSFPNILAEPGKMNCDYKNEHYGIWDQTQIPEDVYMINPLNQEIRKFLSDESNHRIYSFDGREHLGLLSVLIDPRVELRWANFQEFSTYWNQTMGPTLLRYLLRVRQEYYVSLDDYFNISTQCDHIENSLLRSNCQLWRSEVDITTPISENEVDQRAQAFRTSRESDEAYYSMVGVAESFAEEARTYAYISRRIFGQEDELTAFLNAYIPAIHEMVHFLDISRRDLQFDISELSDTEVNARLSNDPAIEVIGQENFENFISSYQNIYAHLMEAKNQWPAVSGENPSEEQLETLSELDSQNRIKGELITNLEQSLQFTVETLLEKYIGGDRIIYLEN
jgi:hypothetical protein